MKVLNLHKHHQQLMKVLNQIHLLMKKMNLNPSSHVLLLVAKIPAAKALVAKASAAKGTLAKASLVKASSAKVLARPTLKLTEKVPDVEMGY